MSTDLAAPLPPAEGLELWAPVPDAPLYDVSTWGRVRRGEYEVASWPNAKGYHVVSLEIDCRPRLRYVHRLVLHAFAGPPRGRQANHDDGRKGHNALDNLAWATASANTAHAWARGLIARTRARRTVCRYGHPLDELAARLETVGLGTQQPTRMRKLRCPRCRRVALRRARDRRAGLLSLFDDATPACDSSSHAQP